MPEQTSAEVELHRAIALAWHVLALLPAELRRQALVTLWHFHRTDKPPPAPVLLRSLNRQSGARRRAAAESRPFAAPEAAPPGAAPQSVDREPSTVAPESRKPWVVIDDT